MKQASATRRRLTLGLLASGLVGCGSLLRAELGPTWIADRGTGGTVQLTAGLPIVAGSGVADVLVVGGAATVVQGEVFAGLATKGRESR